MLPSGIDKQAFIDEYLQRIGLSETPAFSADGLAVLQRAHLLAVPFENLDILQGKIPLSLTIDNLYIKIVKQRRGGICYELNVLFASLLESLGYSVVLQGGSHPKYGDAFDHAFLTVNIDAATYLVDVGFADNPLIPVLMDTQAWQSDGCAEYRVQPSSEHPGLSVLARKQPAQHQTLFTFSGEPCSVDDYRPRCNWYCTNEQSRFTQGALVTLALPRGRKTLSSNHLIRTEDGVRTERNIADSDQFETVLKTEFDLRLEHQEQ